MCHLKSVTLVVDVTRDCNLRCSYCYIRGGEYTNVIKPEDALLAIQKIGEKFNVRVNVLFHGGEPLLALNTIKVIVDQVENSGWSFDVRFYIQTNATLITDEIADYLKEKSILVGVSLDGITAESNNGRVFANGDPSHLLTMNGLRLLIAKGHDVSVLSVLNQKNLKHLDALVDWLVYNGIRSFALNPYIEAGRGSEARLGLTTGEMVDSYIRVFNKITGYHQEKNITIVERNLFQLYKLSVKTTRPFMCMCSPCGAGLGQFALDSSGEVYPCADFCGIPQFSLGKVSEDFIGSLVNSKLWMQLRVDLSEHLNECTRCELRGSCPAGCWTRRFFTNGDLLSVDPLCGFFKHMVSYLGRGDVRAVCEKIFEIKSDCWA